MSYWESVVWGGDGIVCMREGKSWVLGLVEKGGGILFWIE